MVEEEKATLNLTYNLSRVVLSDSSVYDNWALDKSLFSSLALEAKETFGGVTLEPKLNFNFFFLILIFNNLKSLS